MATRAYWKGSLKLSLVSCPVLLYPSSTASDKPASTNDGGYGSRVRGTTDIGARARLLPFSLALLRGLLRGLLRHLRACGPRL
jgi:hypothetical protein